MWVLECMISSLLCRRKGGDNKNLLCSQVIFSPVIGKQLVCWCFWWWAVSAVPLCTLLPADMRRQIYSLYICSPFICVSIYVLCLQLFSENWFSFVILFSQWPLALALFIFSVKTWQQCQSSHQSHSKKAHKCISQNVKLFLLNVFSNSHTYTHTAVFWHLKPKTSQRNQNLYCIHYYSIFLITSTGLISGLLKKTETSTSAAVLTALTDYFESPCQRQRGIFSPASEMSLMWLTLSGITSFSSALPSCWVQ